MAKRRRYCGDINLDTEMNHLEMGNNLYFQKRTLTKITSIHVKALDKDV